MLTLNEPEGDLWDRFERGALAGDDLEAHPVLKRWVRARALGACRAGSMISPERLNADELRERLHRSATVVTCSRDALEVACAELRGEGLAVLLADQDGVLLTSRGVDGLCDPDLRASLVEGLRLSEVACGTNAIGTALAEQSAVAVIGRAHYQRASHRFCGYAAPIRDGADRTVGVLDISGPREAAHPLLGILVQSLAHRLESCLRSKQLRLTPILETLPIAVWVADAEGNLVLSNGAARRLWGDDPHVPIEQYDRYTAHWPDGRRLASAEWGMARALRTGEVVVDEELSIETFDGQRKVIRNSAAPVMDDAGRIVGAVAVNEDITLLKRAEATRDLFAGILGHDLRNPLSAIKMAAALLLRGEGFAPSQQHTVARIQSSAARIESLVDGLLDFTRARFGMAFPIEPAPLDMGEVCARLADETRTAHPERAIELERRGHLGGEWDPARVAQVVSNLIGNAVQHGQDPIVVGVDDAGDSVNVSVSNAGEPIAAHRMASLFEPFRKGDESKGIGLGLFIAREIVRSHGGTIEVASTERATTFRTRWPRARLLR